MNTFSFRMNRSSLVFIHAVLFVLFLEPRPAWHGLPGLDAWFPGANATVDALETRNADTASGKAEDGGESGAEDNTESENGNWGTDREDEEGNEKGGDSPTPAPGSLELRQALNLFNLDKPKEAYEAFRNGRTANPRLAPAGVLMALLYFQKGDVASAHRFLNMAVEECPEDPEAWFQLARFAADDGRIPELGLLLEHGKLLLEKAVQESGQDVNHRFQYLENEFLSLSARLAQAKGDLAGAEAVMREYVQRNPGSWEGLLSLGYLFLEQDRQDDAVSVFDQAQALNSECLSGWLTATSLLDEKGKRNEARELMAKHYPIANSDGNGTVSEPSGLSTQDCCRILVLFFRWGQLDNVRKTVTLLPDGCAERIKWEAQLDYCYGDFEEAEKKYRQALRLNPSDFEIMNGFILSVVDQNDKSSLPEALEKAEAARRKYPDSVDAAGTLAWAELHKGRTERAEDILLPFLDHGEITPTTAYYLACAAVLRGGRELAEQLLVNALDEGDFFPKRPEAEILLDQLRKMDEGEGGGDVDNFSEGGGKTGE